MITLRPARQCWYQWADWKYPFTDPSSTASHPQSHIIMKHHENKDDTINRLCLIKKKCWWITSLCSLSVNDWQRLKVNIEGTPSKCMSTSPCLRYTTWIECLCSVRRLKISNATTKQWTWFLETENPSKRLTEYMATYAIRHTRNFSMERHYGNTINIGEFLLRSQFGQGIILIKWEHWWISMKIKWWCGALVLLYTHIYHYKQ